MKYDYPEPFSDSNSDGIWNESDVEHTWPIIQGTFWENCMTCKGNMPGGLTDYKNGITDYVYLFFPDVTFNGSITAANTFDPDGSGVFDNPDINALISYIHFLISDLLTSRKGRE